MKRTGLLLGVLSSLALAQPPAWPPTLEAGQTWNFVLSGGGQEFRWSVQLGPAAQGVHRASASGVDSRSAEVAYFAGAVPGTGLSDVLVFDFKAPGGPSSFARPFACAIPKDGRGSVVLAPGVVCTATLGAAPAGAAAPAAAEAPVWLREARRVPVAGQTWRLEAFSAAWSLTMRKAESDGFSGGARVVENRSGDTLPPDWDFRLTYLGRSVRIDLSVGQATISCVLDDQFQNAVNGALRAEANLFRQGAQGSQAQSSCRVVLP